MDYCTYQLARIQPGVGKMPNKYIYLGKSILNKGHLLNIPSQLREAFSINAGDSLEMHVEGKMIVLKPIKESVGETLNKNNIVLFPSIEQTSPGPSPVGEVKYPLRLVEGQIDKVV